MEGHFMFHLGGDVFQMGGGGIFNWGGGCPIPWGGVEKNCWMGGHTPFPPPLHYEKPGNPLLKRVCCNRWKELMIMLVHSCI